jgi:hypothetical protein
VTCASLKLSEGRFLIHEFLKHQRIERGKENAPNGTAEGKLGPEGLEFGPKEFEIGALGEIYNRRETCALCRLIAKSLQDQVDLFMEETAGNTENKFYESFSHMSCYLSWQIDGRILIRDPNNKITGSRPCTRRLRLRWKRNETQQRNQNEQKEEVQVEWPDSFIVLMEKKSTMQNLFLARSLETYKPNAALVQRWLKFCDESHGDSCKPFTPNGPVSRSIFGVIDVKTMCLTKLPTGARYVALSYMWGPKTPWKFQTKKNNIKDLITPGGLHDKLEKMPRTIRDSISLVTEIGERYLWVDALCIIQDSARSWALNSRLMNVVYGNAYFTICAADGTDANAGLRALHNPSQQQNIAFYSRDIRLKCLQPAEHYIRNSTWNTRGWTFQERLLSPRTLIFTERRMFFQCRRTARSVDVITEDENAGWSMEFRDSPSLMLEKLPGQPLLVYKESLQLYMKRKLTFAKDILAAFTGIGNLVCDALGGSLVYGLPSSHFDWALLWEPQDAAARRPQVEHEKFPSWSWCGWRNENMDFQYKERMLTGVEDNLQDWLLNHTWITWYIRDGNGNLRLVWNGETGPPGHRTASSWKGYRRPVTPLPSADYDRYGRFINPSEKHLKRDQGFELILDEFPFDVEIVQGTDAHAPNSTDKDMPFLQFFSWSAYFRIREDKRFSYPDTQNFRFRRYNIEDYKDDWCGTIMLDYVWAVKRDLELEDPLEFVAISDAKLFHEDEYNDWANYIPMERNQSTWDLYYVWLIEYRDDIAYRVGLGKVYKEAFKKNSCKPGERRWKEFILG